jgi:glycosyltransferase involved in cell wall biosynthesis
MILRHTPPRPGLVQASIPLRVALVAPPWYPLPPADYGGIERVVYLLGRELLRRGHLVTTFGQRACAPDLPVSSLAPEAWSEDLGGRDEAVRLATYLSRVQREIRKGTFDLVHDHCATLGVAIELAARSGLPVFSTQHGPVTAAEADFYAEVDGEVDLIAISRAQEAASPRLRWRAVVYNAVSLDELSFSAEKDDYLIQLARISPEKGQHVAIEIARAVGLPLLLAGKVGEEPAAQEYFQTRIEPALGEGVRWLENVGGEHKATLLARARAMLFPIQWDEPFGIAVVEAMASGTPVLAISRGAMPELVEPGVTGFLGADAEALIDAFQHLSEIDPQRCAESSLRRFSPETMATAYESAYRAALPESAIA